MPPANNLTQVADYSQEEIQKAHQILYNEGLRMRIQVAGEEYVNKSLSASSTPFLQPMQQYVAEACWGWTWTRPGLELKTRSFLNIAMLCAQNRGTELATHVKGALNNGASEEEIREVILQAATYCGMPAGIEGFRVAGKAVEEWKAEKGVHPSESGSGHVAGGSGAARQHEIDAVHEDIGLDVRMDTKNV